MIVTPRGGDPAGTGRRLPRDGTTCVASMSARLDDLLCARTSSRIIALAPADGRVYLQLWRDPIRSPSTHVAVGGTAARVPGHPRAGWSGAPPGEPSPSGDPRRSTTARVHRSNVGVDR